MKNSSHRKRKWGRVKKDLMVLWVSIRINLLIFILLAALSSIALTLINGLGFQNLFIGIVKTIDYAFAIHVAIPDNNIQIAESLISIFLPFIVIIIFGEGFLRTFSLFVSRNTNRREWNKMMASTITDHYVILGVGEMGKAIVNQIFSLDEKSEIILVDLKASIGVELESDNPNICFIQGDMANPETMNNVNLDEAKAIFVATPDDVLNLTVGMKIAEMYPKLKLWIRLYSSQLKELIRSEEYPNLKVFCPYEGAATELFRQFEN